MTWRIVPTDELTTTLNRVASGLVASTCHLLRFMLLSVFAQNDTLFSPDDTCIVSRPYNNESGGYGIRIGDFAIPPLIAGVGFSAVFNHLNTVRGGMPPCTMDRLLSYRRRGCSRIIGVLSRWDANLGMQLVSCVACYIFCRDVAYEDFSSLAVCPAIYYLSRP